MTVVLFILKIIGIVILAVLALVLLILAAVLFVPWRYRVCADLEENEEECAESPEQSEVQGMRSDDSESPEQSAEENVNRDIRDKSGNAQAAVSARMHWLLHIVGAEVSYRNGQMDAYLRIFFWRKKLLNNEEAQEDEEKFREDAKSVAENAAEEAVKPSDAAKKETVTPLDNRSSEVTEKSHTNYADSSGNDTEIATENVRNEQYPVTESESDRKKDSNTEKINNKQEENKQESIKDKDNKQKENEQEENSNGIFARIKKLWNDFSNFRKKVTRMVEDEGNHRAVAHLKAELIRLLQVIRPRKLSIDLEFSLGSPDLTGEVLGVCAWFPIFYQSGNRLTPDFEADKAYAKGDVDAKGRIYLFQIVAIILRVLFDKDCKRMYRMFRKYF